LRLIVHTDVVFPRIPRLTKNPLSLGSFCERGVFYIDGGTQQTAVWLDLSGHSNIFNLHPKGGEAVSARARQPRSKVNANVGQAILGGACSLPSMVLQRRRVLAKTMEDFSENI
jgi:hypothetical protein